MDRIKTTRISAKSDAGLEELVGELLEPLVRLFMAGGLSADDIRRQVQTAIDRQHFNSDAPASLNLGSRQRDCMEVMCVWRRNREFLGTDGLPIALPEGGAGPSFESLCRASGVASDPHSLLETLKSFGAVKVLTSGHIEAQTPTFLLGNPDSKGEIAADGVIKQIAGFVRSVEHNVLEAPGVGRTRFERACSVVVPAELVPIFERTVRERGQLFVDVLDEWLERHRDQASPSNQYFEVGAGAYFLDLGSVNKN